MPREQGYPPKAAPNQGINQSRAPPRTMGDQFAKITIVASENSALRVDERGVTPFRAG